MKKQFWLTSLFLSGAAAVVSQNRPNIVVILADDLGTNELGCYGGANLQTPHIDSLAAQGIRLTNHFSSCAMSVPARASLYTGLFPARHGSYQNHKSSYNNLKSVTHYLSDLNYRVGRTGKNHPVNQSAVYAFEEIPGFTVDCVSPTANYTTTGIAEFIQRKDDQPFCLFVCSINPHMPWTWGDASAFDPNRIALPPNCVDNVVTRNNFCKYLAEVKELDNEVGAVVNVLQTANKLDNTLVIFLGEQGPQMPFGKWTCYRYGQHSAFIARYPDRIAREKVSDALVQYEDILPTMIDFAGGNPVPDLDGSSCLGVLYGETTEHRNWAYGIHNNIPEGDAYPIRSIQDKRYKLIVNLTPEANYYEKHMMNPNDAGSIWNSWLTTAQNNENAAFLTNRFVNRPAIELYDLQVDPWELNNLAGDAGYGERMAVMKAELEQWMQQQGDRGAGMDTENPEDPSLKIPLPVSNVEDIDNLVRNDLSGNYYLTGDIEIPEETEWIPVGASSAADNDPQSFKGVFDGRGYSIKNLKIRTAGNFKGLFGRLYHATVRNLDLDNVDITGLAPTGAVTGAMIGESLIERVSVSGAVSGGSEIGGIAGRIARDPTYPDYNLIRDCYVTATITATRRTNDMNAPSVAGGIAAFSHGNSGGNTGKIDIRRCYVSGAVISQENAAIAGNAAGILAFYDNHNFVKMEEVIVLCDTIGAATPNLFFSRRGPTYDQFELFDKVYSRTGIILNYLNTNDKGRGAEIPEGIIRYFPADTYKTRQFYDDNLSWDFDNIWTITEGEYPRLKKGNDFPTSLIKREITPEYQIVSVHNGINICFPGDFSASLFDMTGRIICEKTACNQLFIPVKKGMYIVKIEGKTNCYSDKMVVM